jgi:heterotetrameric sarcosine oxidase gamma subunit
MPDRGKFWSPVPDWSAAGIRRPGLDIAVARAGAIWLVSGDLAMFLTQHHDGADCIGPRDTIAADRYALRLAPDRLLFVHRAAAQTVPEALGWSNDGLALTDVSDGILLFDVTGPAAPDVMAQGAEYDFTSKTTLPTEAATMLFAGLKVSIARIPAGWRLHIERPYAAALWQWLEHATQGHARAAAPAGASSSQ